VRAFRRTYERNSKPGDEPGFFLAQNHEANASELPFLSESKATDYRLAICEKKP
jgi:hypothetical protein